MKKYGSFLGSPMCILYPHSIGASLFQAPTSEYNDFNYEELVPNFTNNRNKQPKHDERTAVCFLFLKGPCDHEEVEPMLTYE